MISLEVISVWYNEEFLAPLFLNHYSYADKITLLYDSESNDNTLDIIKKFANVHIIPFKFPNMFDDNIKIGIINEFYRKSPCDYVMSVDSDEFVFLKNGDRFIYNIMPWLEQRRSYDIFISTLLQIYKHKDDAEIIPHFPAIPQRRHGTLNTGEHTIFNKPVIAKTKKMLEWQQGCHRVIVGEKNLKICEQTLLGAHWAMADPGFSINRRINNRKIRMSKENIKNKLGWHYMELTEESMMEEFRTHENDPILF